jgi:hypothetical protein
MSRMKTLWWALLIAGAWFAWFIAEAFLMDWRAGALCSIPVNCGSWSR